jgi:hypothetical protein
MIPLLSHTRHECWEIYGEVLMELIIYFISFHFISFHFGSNQTQHSHEVRENYFLFLLVVFLWRNNSRKFVTGKKRWMKEKMYNSSSCSWNLVNVYKDKQQNKHKTKSFSSSW